MKYLIQFLQSKKKMLAFIILLALFQSFGTLMVPYFVAKIIDKGILEKNVPVIISIGLQMLAAAGITALITLWGSYLCADLSALTGKYMREKLFDKSQQLSIKEFNHIGTASMITRATGDITVIQQTMIMITQMVLPTPLIAVAAIVMTAGISPDLVYIPLTGMLLFFIVIFFLFKKASPISKTIQKRVDVVNRIVRESIVGIRVIRAFDNTEYEKKRSDDTFTEYANNVIRLNRTFAAFNPLVWAIMGLAMAAVVWFGGDLVLRQTIQIGSISAVTEYTIMTLMFLMMSAMVLVYIPRMTACLDRIQEVLDINPEIADATEVCEADTDNQNKITFQNVTFTYKGAEEPVLEDMNFLCEQGKTTAIIGGTGSGKSTVAALMLRLYDIQKGQILLEGKDIRDITQHELRERISYVPQKAFLFSGTIADNLRMGKKDATIEELRKAAEIAQADSFINSLEAGYDSPVAQAGINFSGGQKQRLCIARALVKKAPVYVFDDSFSALDFKTDAALRGALKHEMRESAVVIIAQRISTIMDADQIIVLDAGSIAGVGTHQELLKTCSVYKEIADSQLTEKEAGRV
ncbi:ATP-binding cassette, subfamily B [Anaerocolumna jejuensis DSM 15929]|uniref:ATP-binding cassette, subfamily B n=1 Tax=Anaerocolumna jejuensis DSM 15929 TaxID=1121322 RepID=A0A1M6VRH8_9FIRM|nr:ABC transporter ATP-binding protein [Anaerocolumna jejuensis]SHK83941.1 ATP-binding cassette, subfamily B [Anaerocolumna jejuensis DSM 15929]